jgi:archaellum component FlaC
MPTTVTSLEDRTNLLEEKIEYIKTDVHLLTTEFASFKGKIETVVSLIRWIGIFVAGLAVTVIFSVISFAHSAGRLESNIDRLKEATQHQEQVNQKQLDGFKEALQKQDDLIRRLEIKMTEISTKLNNIDDKLKK